MGFEDEIGNSTVDDENDSTVILSETEEEVIIESSDENSTETVCNQEVTELGVESQVIDLEVNEESADSSAGDYISAVESLSGQEDPENGKDNSGTEFENQETRQVVDSEGERSSENESNSSNSDEHSDTESGSGSSEGESGTNRGRPIPPQSRNATRQSRRYPLRERLGKQMLTYDSRGEPKVKRFSLFPVHAQIQTPVISSVNAQICT